MRTTRAFPAISPDAAGVTGPLLDSEAVLREGVAALAALDPVMARLAAEGAAPVLRKRPPGFAGLAGIVVGQQISTASAAAIWGRLTARMPDLTPQALAAAPDDLLREAGLSAPKIRTLRAAAAAILDGTLPLDTLHALPADEAHRLMVAVHGIGPWTADVYLLFCLGHPDAARLADGLETRPSAAALTRRADAWRPWRGVAAKVLWAYYRVAKARDGAPLSS